MRRLFLLLLLLSATAATAQTRRAVYPTQLWPEAQAELALANGDYLLLALRGERVLSEGGFRNPRHLGFDAGRLTLGYEHFWNERWSWGGTARFTGGNGQYETFVPEALLRHRAPTPGGLTFGQRLSVERSFLNTSGLKGGPGPDGQTNVRLRLDLEKLLPLGSAGLALRPRLSYETATRLRLQKADTDPSERTIQLTSLRAEVGVRVSPRFDFTPWFARQTVYLIELPQFDASGAVKIAGGNTNNVVPTFGLDLRYSLFSNRLSEADRARRVVLPTQH